MRFFRHLKARSRLTKIRWFTLYYLRNQHFAKALDLDPDRKVFSSGFVENIARRKSDLERTYWRLNIANLAIIAVLFLNTSIVDTEFSFAGVKASDISKIKEVLLFTWASLNFVSSIMIAEAQALDGILHTWLTKVTKSELVEFARLQFGQRIGAVPSIPGPHLPHHLQTVVFTVWTLVSAIAVVVFILAFFVAMLVVNITVIIEVIRNPSLSEPWSSFIVAYAIVGFLMSFLFLFFRWIPLPYRDYTVVMELSELQKKDKKAYEEKIRELLRK